MEKIRKTTEQVIDSTKIMAQHGEDNSELIKSICKTHQLTLEFVNEFRKYIDIDSFSTSKKLKLELINEFPELFSENIFIENIYENNPHIKTLVKYFNNLKNSGIDNYKLEDIVVASIRECEPDEIDYEVAGKFIGAFGKDVDELLLKRISDPEIREGIILSLATESDKYLTSEMFAYMSNEGRETILGTTDVSPEDFISAISSTNDLGWVNKMLDKAMYKEIKLKKVMDTFDDKLVYCVSKLPEELLLKLFSLSEESFPNALSYKIMVYVLNNNNLSEHSIISLIERFKKAGLYFELKKYAERFEMDDLLKKL